MKPSGVKCVSSIILFQSLNDLTDFFETGKLKYQFY